MNNYIPSPPASPYLNSFTMTHDHQDQIVCGECDKSLGADWFCSNCHTKCDSCNRFLGENEYCTRCWSFDPVHHQFSRKYQASTFSGLPSPSNSTGSLSGPKLLTRSFTWKH